jgi:transposase InsO family protein
MCVDWGVSIRRACGAICFDTSTYHYRSRRTDHAAVERRIKEIAETRVRCPKTIRVDNGSEFISRDLDLWAYANDVTLDFSRAGKSTDNGFIEAFNSTLRAECLNAH